MVEFFMTRHLSIKEQSLTQFIGWVRLFLESSQQGFETTCAKAIDDSLLSRSITSHHNLLSKLLRNWQLLPVRCFKCHNSMEGLVVKMEAYEMRNVLVGKFAGQFQFLSEDLEVIHIYAPLMSGENVSLAEKSQHNVGSILKYQN